MDDEDELDAAYALRSPADARALYRAWAASYDDDFAASRDYLLPAHVAEIFAGHAEDADAPVLDVGAGTGLVAEALQRHGSWPIEALDLSAEMLAVARAKGLYGAYLEADLTDPASLPRRRYGAIVSAGTFTHGHLGADCLARLVDLARPGALMVISINAAHFEQKGFAAAFEALAMSIGEPLFVEVPIYGAAAGDDHDGDLALIAVFRRA